MPLDYDALRELGQRGGVSDRAFVDSMVRLAWARESAQRGRVALRELQAAVLAAALRSHAELRAQIADGSLRGVRLRKRFDAVPPEERDHFVEEALGVAYPPLEQISLSTDLMSYTPSGYDEIVYALDVTRLGPGQRLLDLGSGMGKAVMLAALLAGASGAGVERDGSLVSLAQAASRELGLSGARFLHGDARDVVFGGAEVVFMYLPFSGSVLSSVMRRLLDAWRSKASPTQRFLCCGALDVARYRELAVAAPPKSWLNVYALR